MCYGNAKVRVALSRVGGGCRASTLGPKREAARQVAKTLNEIVGVSF